MHRNAITVTLLCSSLLGAGCMRGPHVRLSSPPADAPPAERVASFETLRPHAESGTVTLAGDQPVAQTTDFLVLGDGRRVYHADDLVAVVPAESATARAGLHSKAARRRGNGWVGASLAIMAAGAVMMGVAFATAGDPGEEDFGPGPLVFVGLGTFTAGIGTSFFAVRAYRQAHDERVSAFTTYRADLAKQLDVCVDGLHIVACAAQTPEPVAPGEPVPAPAAPSGPAPVTPQPTTTPSP